MTPTARISAKNYHKNPRRITTAQMTRLGSTLAELGDLAGIVVDETSGEIIGGNQRAKVIDLAQCDVEIIQQFDPPTPQGTTALGFILWQDERYAYRQVRWTAEQCARANIVANAAGGDWDWDILRESFDPALLTDAGLDADALAAMQTDAAELAKMLDASIGAKINPTPCLVEQWMVLIECVDESEQKMLLQKFADEGLRCRALIS